MYCLCNTQNICYLCYSDKIADFVQVHYPNDMLNVDELRTLPNVRFRLYSEMHRWVIL